VADLSWRVIRDAPGSGARNMALDHALATSLGPDEAVLRLYGWATPTVSFGRNEPAVASYEPDQAVQRGIEVVRRPTGGRAVLHDAEVTYAVVVPQRAMGGARDTYVQINRGLVAALAALGAPVRVATEGVTAALDAGPCFQIPVDGEVTALGHKLVGSAQARIDGALLQHGSIILSGDQSRLSLLRRPDAAAGPKDRDVVHSATLEALIGPVTPGEVMDAVTYEMEHAVGGSWAPEGYRPEELNAAAHVEETRYRLSEWTWRR
jgi:lipoyl(octanoyl) transferase